MNFDKHEILDDFGKMIMSEVRDKAFTSFQSIISGKMKDATSRQFFEEYKSLSPETAHVLHHFLALAIDHCLAEFLYLFEQHEMPILHALPSGERVDILKISDGIVGELYTEDGWIERFSKFNDRVEPVL